MLFPQGDHLLDRQIEGDVSATQRQRVDQFLFEPGPGVDSDLATMFGRGWYACRQQEWLPLASTFFQHELADVAYQACEDARLSSGCRSTLKRRAEIER